MSDNEPYATTSVILPPSTLIVAYAPGYDLPEHTMRSDNMADLFSSHLLDIIELYSFAVVTDNGSYGERVLPMYRPGGMALQGFAPISSIVDMIVDHVGARREQE